MQDYAFIQVAIGHYSNSTSSSMANVHFEDPEDSGVSLQVPAIPPKQRRTAALREAHTCLHELQAVQRRLPLVRALTELPSATRKAISLDNIRPASAPYSNHLTMNNQTIHVHPESKPPPITWSEYVRFGQTLVSSFLLCGCLAYLVWAVAVDVRTKYGLHFAMIGNKVSICSAMYSTNRCTAPVPAMVAQCMEWQACVDQSILAISHTQVVAQVLIGILNSLAEPLSTKSFVRITVTPWFPPNQ
ncbi:hypothetical protein EYR36_001205 [Pleurotus pulmonarius]|nr:hypothetical protein EYR36_001205 [Pleurotus pulmonarius]